MTKRWSHNHPSALGASLRHQTLKVYRHARILYVPKQRPHLANRKWSRHNRNPVTPILAFQYTHKPHLEDRVHLLK